MPSSDKIEKEEISYSEATKRLDEISGAIERGEVDIDELADNMKEAAELLDLCKSKIERAEMKVQEIAEHLESKVNSDEEERAAPSEAPSAENSEEVPF